MRKENVNLIMLLCLLLSFCSGFASCGDDEEEEYDPCAPFEVALEKADPFYTESNTLYNVTNMHGDVILQKVNGEIQTLICCDPQPASPDAKLYFYPVNLPESVLSEYTHHDWGEGALSACYIVFSGEVKPRLEGMEYDPIVLTYAEMARWCND